MADKRINALTTTSASVGDDYFAIDGATNGTRALSAFSPTFGGNATVTGTLTVNGASLSANGTVAGYNTTSAWDGGPATITPGFAIGSDAGTTRDLMAFGGASRVGLIRGYHDGGGLVQWSIGRYTTGSFGEMVRISGTSATSSSLTVYGTTASTTTSTGALVVSGGVGVAGAIYLGGILVSSGSSSGLAAESRDGSGYRTTWYNPTGDDMQLDFAGIGTKFTITSAGDTTIAGKITTSAPTGGAGAWELGTYSSTAPSATGYVTIEIGGTVYKLLASNV